MLGTGYFLKIAKKQNKKTICPNRKNQSAQNTDTQKNDNQQKLTPAKVSCHMVTLWLHYVAYFRLGLYKVVLKKKKKKKTGNQTNKTIKKSKKD